MGRVVVVQMVQLLPWWLVKRKASKMDVMSFVKNMELKLRMKDVNIWYT